jgi:hypothetical protein
LASRSNYIEEGINHESLYSHYLER